MNSAIALSCSCGHKRSAARRSTAMRWTTLSKVRVLSVCCLVVSSAFSRVQRGETGFFCALTLIENEAIKTMSHATFLIIILCLCGLLQIFRDEWNDLSRHVDRRFDVTRVRKVAGDVYSTHVRLVSFPIINRHFRKFSWLSLHSQPFQQRQIGVAADQHKHDVVLQRQRLAGLS